MSDPHARAIETHYAGCHFRSRLEARWAVFFDHLGVAWEYEPEAFTTSAGNYLPDFRVWIPQVKSENPVWFEVKPSNASPDLRHAALAVDTATPLVLARGMARSYADQFGRGGLGIIWTSGATAPAAFVAGHHPFGSPRAPFYCALGDDRHWCQEHFLESAGRDGTPHLAVGCLNPTNPPGQWSIPPGWWGDSAGHEGEPRISRRVDAAYAAARSARFGS